MRAIILSIHSQVPGVIAGLGHQLDMIVSLDSHLDVSLGGDEEIYPKELRSIAARTGAHSAMRRMIGGLDKLTQGGLVGQLSPRLIVAIPHSMLAKHAEDIESRLPASLRFNDRAKSISSVTEFLAGTLGIEIYQSPPRSLSHLARLAKGTKSWVLDVDVDYMYEMQKECYTQIRGAEPGVLQSMSRVVRFIRESAPETIILSEGRSSAIRNRQSNFSKLLSKLDIMGYKIDESGVLDSDAEVDRGIAVCKEFYRTVSQKLMAKHMAEMMRGNLRGFKREEKSAARKFFKSKGYEV